jgi:hypothetical protein
VFLSLALPLLRESQGGAVCDDCCAQNQRARSTSRALDVGDILVQTSVRMAHHNTPPRPRPRQRTPSSSNNRRRHRLQHVGSHRSWRSRRSARSSIYLVPPRGACATPGRSICAAHDERCAYEGGSVARNVEHEAIFGRGRGDHAVRTSWSEPWVGHSRRYAHSSRRSDRHPVWTSNSRYSRSRLCRGAYPAASCGIFSCASVPLPSRPPASAPRLIESSAAYAPHAALASPAY